MANLLRRFNSQIVGSDGNIYDYLSKITASGDFQRVKNLDVIITSWNNILLTPKGTYFFDPLYGSNLHKIIYQPMSEITEDRIKTEIRSSIGYYDTRASIENITVFPSNNKKGLQILLTAKYEGVIGDLTVSIANNTLVTNEQSTSDEAI